MGSGINGLVIHGVHSIGLMDSREKLMPCLASLQRQAKGPRSNTDVCNVGISREEPTDEHGRRLTLRSNGRYPGETDPSEGCIPGRISHHTSERAPGWL